MSTEKNVVQLLKKMLWIRGIEEELADRYKEQEMRCPMHLCIGQEAIAVGVCENLTNADKVFSNHRAHGHYLAKGGDASAMVSEIYGKETGCCGGRGGSMHLVDLKVGFMGTTPIVGGTVPLAVGSAWASKLRGTAEVAVIFLGDGCFEEGVVHESMNFAALHKLPIIFICENNRFSVYTRQEARQPERPIWKVAGAHGLNAHMGDGNDLSEVIRISSEVVAAARDGRPGFIEFETYRWREHCGPDFDNHLQYRSDAEVQEGHELCAINSFIKKNGIPVEVVEELVAENQARIMDVFKFAADSEKPCPESAKRHVYA
jgi:pyruvate dehydrogenase E1 component alpha subunit